MCFQTVGAVDVLIRSTDFVCLSGKNPPRFGGHNSAAWSWRGARIVRNDFKKLPGAR